MPEILYRASLPRTGFHRLFPDRGCRYRGDCLESYELFHIHLPYTPPLLYFDNSNAFYDI